MASNTNVCIFTGNLTRDAELRETSNGKHVLTFSLAVNDRIESNGTWTDRANYLDFSMFGSRAAAIAGFMVKGKKVAVTSSARWSSWEKDGQKRSKVDFLVRDIELLGGNQSGNASTESNLYDADIPF